MGWDISEGVTIPNRCEPTSPSNRIMHTVAGVPGELVASPGADTQGAGVFLDAVVLGGGGLVFARDNIPGLARPAAQPRVQPPWPFLRVGVSRLREAWLRAPGEKWDRKWKTSLCLP